MYNSNISSDLVQKLDEQISWYGHSAQQGAFHMLILFLALTLVSVLFLLVGFVWILLGTGESVDDSGEGVGAKVMSDRLDDDDYLVHQKMVFTGVARSHKNEASISFSEVKVQLHEGRYSEAVPTLLTIGGLLGLIAFGSLTLFVTMENKLVGGLIMALTIFTVFRIIIRILRA